MSCIFVGDEGWVGDLVGLSRGLYDGAAVHCISRATASVHCKTSANSPKYNCKENLKHILLHMCHNMTSTCVFSIRCLSVGISSV